MTSSSDPLVQELVNRRTIAILSTHNADGSSHLTSVWFVFEDGRFYVGTMTGTRKARNILANPLASILLDVRESSSERGLAAACTATIVSGARSQQLNARIHGRYLSAEALADPRVGAVFAAMDDITIELTPTKWTSWDMRALSKQAFGDAVRPGYFLPLE